MLVHAVLEAFQFALEFGRLEGPVAGFRLGHLRPGLAGAGGTPLPQVHDIGNRLDDALGRDAVGFIEGQLAGAAALGFVDGALHRTGHAVGIENGSTAHIACGAADGLDQRAIRTQEAFLVGIEYRHQRHFRHVEALAQQVDADQHVEFAEAQIADDFHALHRVDVRMQVAHADAVLVEVLGQILGHALGQGGDQHPFLPLDPQVDLRQQVVDLGGRRPQLDLGVHQPRRAHHLLDHLAAVLLLVIPRRGRNEHRLRRQGFPLLEAQGSVVQRRGQAKAVFHQGFLARAVALVHAADLRHRNMAFVDEQQAVLRQVFEQGRRRFARRSAGQVARIVLDAAAIAQLHHHLDVVVHPLLETLHLHQLVQRLQLRQALVEFDLDLFDGLENGLARRNVMGLGIDGHALDPLHDLAGQRVEMTELLDLVVEQLDADRFPLRVGRMDLDHIAAHAVAAAREVHVVARVLQLRQAAQDLPLIHRVAHHQVQQHLEIGLGVAETVDRRHRGHDDGVAPLEQRLGRRQAHLLDVIVDRGILFDEGVGSRHIGLRLVVVVIGNEVLHRVAREEFLHLPVELCRQGLVVGHDDGRALGALDHVGHGKGLAGTGHAEQGLVRQAILDALDQLLDGLRLVAGRLVIGL